MRVVDFDIRHQQHHFGAGDIFRGDPIFTPSAPGFPPSGAIFHDDRPFQSFGGHVGMRHAADAGGDGDNIEVHNIPPALTADSDVETGRFGHHPIWLNFRFVQALSRWPASGFAQKTVFGLAILMKRQQVHFF